MLDGFVVVVFGEGCFTGAHGGVGFAGRRETDGAVFGDEVEKISEERAFVAEFLGADEKLASVNALGFGGVGIGNGGGMIDKTGAPTEENVGVVGILPGEGFKNRQGFDMFLLTKKSHGKFALGLIGVVGRGRSCRGRRSWRGLLCGGGRVGGESR